MFRRDDLFDIFKSDKCYLTKTKKAQNVMLDKHVENTCIFFWRCFVNVFLKIAEKYLNFVFFTGEN